MSDVPFQIGGIDHVVLLVDDMDKALWFWCEVLGCARAFTYADIGMEQVWAGTALIGLWDISNPKAQMAKPAIAGGRNMDHVALSLGPFDWDAMRAHLARHGVEIEREERQGGSRGIGPALYVYDPAGNRVELKGPPDYPDRPG